MRYEETAHNLAAALAVRIVLLQEVSAIGLLQRVVSKPIHPSRDNLAKQVLAVKDFPQLFVISHDDTFE